MLSYMYQKQSTQISEHGIEADPSTFGFDTWVL